MLGGGAMHPPEIVFMKSIGDSVWSAQNRQQMRLFQAE
jgi:hypothetical protein